MTAVSDPSCDACEPLLRVALFMHHPPELGELALSFSAERRRAILEAQALGRILVEASFALLNADFPDADVQHNFAVVRRIAAAMDEPAARIRPKPGN